MNGKTAAERVDEDTVWKRPLEPMYPYPCDVPTLSCVVEAIANDEYAVDEEYENVWSAVHVFAFPRLRPIVLAVPPLYVPENVRVESVAERLARLDPRDTPEIVELVRPVLSRVPVIVGVNVRAPAEGTTFTPRV